MTQGALRLRASELAETRQRLVVFAVFPNQAQAVAKPKFVICGACHGVDGKGNQQLGAPNLTDDIWLYGSSVETIAATIKEGRGSNQLTPGQSAMPAQKDHLGAAKIRLLAAYVYSLGGGMPAPVDSAAAPLK